MDYVVSRLATGLIMILFGQLNQLIWGTLGSLLFFGSLVQRYPEFVKDVALIILLITAFLITRFVFRCIFGILKVLALAIGLALLLGGLRMLPMWPLF